MLRHALTPSVLGKLLVNVDLLNDVADDAGVAFRHSLAVSGALQLDGLFDVNLGVGFPLDNDVRGTYIVTQFAIAYRL
jgi:hypothetical protein